MASKYKHGGGGGGGGPDRAGQPLWLHINAANGRLSLGAAGNLTPPKLQLRSSCFTTFSLIAVAMALGS